MAFNREKVYDVVIAGGGPAGLACAIYTSRARLKTVVLDKAPGAGALAITPRIANYPGLRGEIAGTDLLETMREQAVDFGALYTRSAVQGVDLRSDPKQVFSTEGVYEGRTIVISTGAMGRKQRVPGEEQLTGRGVSYCVICDAPFFEGREAAVVGDSDIALNEALYLARFAAKVHLISPRLEFHASQELVQAVEQEPRIEKLMGWRLVEISGEKTVTGVRLQSFVGDPLEIPVEGVFVLLAGVQPITDFVQGALPVTEDGCLSVDHEQQTALDGVYAVGDVTCSHVKQAVVAAAEGVVAALAIDKYLNKREKVRTDYK